MSESIKCSVIVAIYNVEHYLKRCIDSILSQSYKGFELILVDDGSTDRSGCICDEYEKTDCRVRVIHQNNGGLCMARNTGLDYSIGQFIYCVDADDWIEPDTLELLLNKQLESDADIVTGNYLFHYESGQKTWQMMPYMTKEELVLKMMQKTWDHFVAGRLVRRALFNDNALRWNDGLDVAEDRYMMTALAYYAKGYVLVDRIVYHYENRNIGSLTSFTGGRNWDKLLRNNRQELENVLALERFFKDKEEVYQKECIRCVMEQLWTNLQTACDSSDKEEFHKIVSDIDSRSDTDLKLINWQKEGVKGWLKHNYAFMKLKKMDDKVLTFAKIRIKSFLQRLLYFFPIQKNKIVFINYDFKGYGDNPKYIAEEIIRQGLPCKLIWLIQDDCFVPPYIKKVYMRGLAWYFELSTAGIIITNRKGILIPSLYKKKRKQFFLQTWHGDFPLKYIEKEVEDTLWPDYLMGSKADSAVTNAIISGNKQFTKILEESFWLPKECTILEYGVPRNDIYFKGLSFKNHLKTEYGFSLEDSILLYAPTFRDDYDISCYNIDFERLRRFMFHTTGKRWKIIIRLHPNISYLADRFCYNDSIINGTVYEDQQELCMISDCLITDYSSIMADFMLMKKPVFLYVMDYDRYSNHNTGRGLRDVYYKLPFSFCRTQDELEECISSFDKENYEKVVSAFMLENYDSFDDGHSSENVVIFLKTRLKNIKH